MNGRLNRRTFVKLGGASLAWLGLGAWSTKAAAQEKVSISDPTAQALKYTLDASTVDPAQAPTYKEGQHCGSCMLYQTAAEQDGFAPCSAFGGRLVARAGWCSAWVAKAQ